MDALSRTLARMQQMNMMRQQFSQNSSNFYSMKAGILPNSGIGLPSGGASLRSTGGISLPGNKKKKKPLPPAIQEAIDDDNDDDEEVPTQPTPEDKSKSSSPKAQAAAERSAKSKGGLSGTVQQLFTGDSASKEDAQTSATQPPSTVPTSKEQDAVIKKLMGGNTTGLEYAKGSNSKPVVFIGDDGKTEYFSSVTAYAKKLGLTKHKALGKKKLTKRGQVMKTTLSSNSKGYTGVLVTTDRQTLERLGVTKISSGKTDKVIRGLTERLQELSVPSAPSPKIKAAIAKSRKSKKNTVKIGESS